MVKPETVCVCALCQGNHRAGEVMHVSEPTQDSVSGTASCYGGVKNFSGLVFTPSLPSPNTLCLFFSLNQNERDLINGPFYMSLLSIHCETLYCSFLYNHQTNLVLGVVVNIGQVLVYHTTDNSMFFPPY